MTMISYTDMFSQLLWELADESNITLSEQGRGMALLPSSNLIVVRKWKSIEIIRIFVCAWFNLANHQLVFFDVVLFSAPRLIFPWVRKNVLSPWCCLQCNYLCYQSIPFLLSSSQWFQCCPVGDRIMLMFTPIASNSVAFTLTLNYILFVHTVIKLHYRLLMDANVSFMIWRESFWTIRISKSIIISILGWAWFDDDEA